MNPAPTNVRASNANIQIEFSGAGAGGRGTGVTMLVVAVLLLGFGSNVVLPAVVKSWTVPGAIGVNTVVQVIVPPTASGLAGVLQVVVVPAGVPPGKLTTQVAFAAGFGPAFVHVVVTDTGMPTVPATFAGADACISALRALVSVHTIAVSVGLIVNVLPVSAVALPVQLSAEV